MINIVVTLFLVGVGMFGAVIVILAPSAIGAILNSASDIRKEWRKFKDGK